MNPSLTLLFIYCGLVVASSVVGGQLSQLVRLTHLRTQLLMSGVGGLMIGIAMMHLLPQAVWTLQSPSKMGAGALTGLIAMFLLIRLFPTHDHAHPGQPSSCQHNHESDDHDHLHEESRGITWLGLFLGLTLHTIVDGVALAASVMAEARHGWGTLAGLGTFMAVALHKPLDSFAITSLMKKQHWTDGAQNLVNIAFSLSCPLGAAAFYFGAKSFGDSGTEILGWGLAISGGFFIGIALADLLPEVAFHQHDKGILTAALLGGVLTAVLLENLPGHDHASHRLTPEAVNPEVVTPEAVTPTETSKRMD